MKIGIVGFGKMGSDIFRLISAARSDEMVVVAENEGLAKEGEKKIFKRLERSFKRGVLKQDEFLRNQESLEFTHYLEALSSADLVIEAIFENYDEKASMFRRLESVVSPDTVVVTNTSSLSIESLAQGFKNRDRFCGLHFFYPASLTGLVEIITLSDTPQETVEFLQVFCDGIGKKPIVVHDAPGSVINSILAYYYVEALYLLEEGYALPSEVDSLARRFFYVGPCESMDVIGIDFFIKAMEIAATPGSLAPIRWREDARMQLTKQDTGGREGFHVPSLFQKLIAHGRIGKRASKGIYLYEKNVPKDDAPSFYKDPDHGPVPTTLEGRDDFIARRLLFSVFNGALYSVSKGLSSIEDVDMGVKEVLLMKAGPFSMMRAMGIEHLEEEFNDLAEKAGRRFLQGGFRSALG